MVAPRARLYLIDGSSYIFRAFFALPPMSNSNELPTHAIYGFTTMTLKFLKEYQPELLAVVLDKGRVTFRNEIYHEYKSNRPEAPPDLIPQFPYIRKILEAMNIPALELAGFEADRNSGQKIFFPRNRSRYSLRRQGSDAARGRYHPHS